MTRHVSAVFDDHQRAAEAIQLLKQNQFTDREMTVVAKSDDSDQAEGQLRRSLEQESGRGGAWVGSALGAAVAGSVGLMSMALIPAVPLLMVGAAAAGGAAGNLFGSTGVAPELQEQAERALREGGVLVIVHQETDERAQLAKDLLTRSGPRGVSIGSA